MAINTVAQNANTNRVMTEPAIEVGTYIQPTFLNQFVVMVFYLRMHSILCEPGTIIFNRSSYPADAMDK